MWMDDVPRGFNHFLVRVAQGVALLTLLGYVVLVAYLLDFVTPNFAAPLMALFAGMKLIHDGIIALVRYRLHAALSRVSFLDVAISPFATGLIFGSVAVQVWG